jgi:hypothetical protein
LFEPVDNLGTNGRFSQSPGNIIVNANKIIIPPEIDVQTTCGIVINAVLHFNIRVNKTIEKISEPIMTYDLRLSFPSTIELPTITGRSGKIHGASIVSIPAINEVSSRIILFYFGS